MRVRPLVPVALITLAALLPSAAPDGALSWPEPRDLRASHDPKADATSLAWQEPQAGTSLYKVYRGNDLLGKTSSTSFGFQEELQALTIYLVTAEGPDGVAGRPAVAALPAPTCEVASITVTWSPPFAYVHAHEECLDGTANDLGLTWRGA